MKTALTLGVSCCLALAAPRTFAQNEAAAAEAKDPAVATAAPSTPPASVAPASKAEAAPKIDLRVQEQPPPVARSYHVHDGFYLRVNLGIGALGNDYDLGPTSAESHGGTLAFDVLVGGTPGKGLALGGALLNEAGVSHSVEQKGGRSLGDANVRLSLLGPFVDGFFDAKGGFHMGGAVGFASLAVEDLSTQGDTDNLTGFGGAAWLGYDAWVAEEWSIGGLVRAGGAITKKSGDVADITAQSFSLGLMLSVLYH